MYKLCFIYILSLVCGFNSAFAQDPDTVWTQNFIQYKHRSECARFMPDGKSIIAGVGNTLYEFETASGKLIRIFDSQIIPEDNKVVSVEISFNGKIIVGRANNTKTYYWDYEKGICINQFTTHDLTFDDPYSYIFHPYKNYLFTCVNDTLIKYNLTTFKSEKFGKLKKIGYSKLAISSDGKLIALSYDYINNIDDKRHCSLEIWDAENLVRIKILDDITREVRAIKFSPSGNYVAFTTNQDEECFLRIYHLDDGTKEIYPSAYLGFQPFGIIPLEGDSTILVSGGDKTKLMTIKNGTTHYYIPHSGDQTNIDINSSNQIIFDEVLFLYLVNSNWSKTNISGANTNVHSGNLTLSNHTGKIILNNIDNEIIKYVNIFDINGKLIKTYEAGYSGSKIELPFSAASGVYLARIVTVENDYGFRFVVSN